VIVKPLLKFGAICIATVLGIVAVLAWRLRITILVLLPITYEIVKWPLLLHRDLASILVALIPIIYLLGVVKKNSKQRKIKKTGTSLVGSLLAIGIGIAISAVSVGCAVAYNVNIGAIIYGFVLLFMWIMLLIYAIRDMKMI